MRDFRKMNIWQDGMKNVKDVYQLSEKLPAEEKYGLKSQICRAAVSIPSNIAEGCSKSSQKDFKRYLEIAIGSAFELETQLIIIEDLDLIQEKNLNVILTGLHKNQKMINSLITRIKASS